MKCTDNHIATRHGWGCGDRKASNPGCERWEPSWRPAIYLISPSESVNGSSGASRSLLPPRRPPSFIERTNQKWKLRVVDVLNLTGLALFLGACWFRQEPSSAGILAGTGLGGISLAWSCLAIRCPRGRTRAIWHSYSHRSAREAEAWARFQLVCPQCGFLPPPEQTGVSADTGGA